jgi:ABC-2 type transport system ATP-binding protein
VSVSQDRLQLRAPVASGSGLASAVVRALDEEGASVDDVEVRPPSLDDVFFALTGHAVEAPSTTDDTGNDTKDQ